MSSVASGQAFKVEHLKSTTMNLIGEAPFYDLDTGFLYWVDIVGAQIFRMDTTNDSIITAKISGQKLISFMFPVKGSDNEFIVGAFNKLLLISWDGVHTMAKVVRVLVELSGDIRFNDAETDSLGRLYVGTMISGENGTVFDLTRRVGSLYRYTMVEGLVQLRDNVGLSNGIVIDEKKNKMYYVDSYDLNVKSFSWDAKTGNISGEKILIDLTPYGSEKTCVPDGITLDNEGNIYIAMFGGSKILKFNTTTAKLLTQIDMPANQITSVAFGGPQLETLFVTTAGMDVVSPQKYPAGYLFKVTNLGVRGMQMTRFTVEK